MAYVTRIDNSYIKPCLIYDYENRKQELKNIKKVIKLNQDRLEGMTDLHQYFLVMTKAELENVDLQMENISFKRVESSRQQEVRNQNLLEGQLQLLDD